MEKYIMKVNGCCCCFTLRTGTLILLWLGLISSVWNLVTKASNLALITNSPGADTATKFVISVIFFYFFVHLVFLSIIPCALGLYGIYENRPSYLKPYIFVSIFEIVCILISCVFLFLVLIFDAHLLANLLEEGMKQNGQDPKNMGAAVGVTVFLLILVLLGVAFLSWYFLSVVYRYYLQLKGVQPTSYSTSDYNAPPRYDGPMKA